MNKLVVFTSSVLLSITFCTCQNGVNNKQVNNDTIKGKEEHVNEFKSKMLGVWKLEGDENPTFEIKKDSIYYIDQGEMYSYKTNKDSIVIFYKDFIYKGIYTMEKGKLILIEGTNKSIYFKWEAK
jgi:hypothetical protein